MSTCRMRTLLFFFIPLMALIVLEYIFDFLPRGRRKWQIQRSQLQPDDCPRVHTQTMGRFSRRIFQGSLRPVAQLYQAASPDMTRHDASTCATKDGFQVCCRFVHGKYVFNGV